MGNCRSSASIYFAAHAEHEKLRPVVDALSLRDGEAMHLFMAFEKMRLAHAEETGSGSSEGGDGGDVVGFRAFVKCLGLQPTKFVLNAFAHGCAVPRRAFPKVKEGASMSLEQFLRCATHLLVRNDEGLRTLIFSLYREKDGGGISADNTIRLIHDLYDRVGDEKTVKGAQSSIRKAENIIRDTAEWDERSSEKRLASTPFSWEEFNTLVRSHRFVIRPVYNMQSAMRISLGGSGVWNKMKGRVGEEHSGMLKDIKWQPRRQMTFGSEVGDTRDEETGLRPRGS